MTDTQARMDQAFALVAAAVDVLLARTQGMDGLDENLQLSRVLDDLQVAGADPASPEVLDDDALAGESVVSLLERAESVVRQVSVEDRAGWGLSVLAELRATAAGAARLGV